MWRCLIIMGCVSMLMGVKSSAITEIEEAENKLQKCKCANFDCRCCNHIELDFLKINGTLCSDISYLPDDIGISMTITYNNITIFNETVSVRNPPPICPIFVEDLHIEACIRFYNMDFGLDHLDGCAKAEITLFRSYPFEELELGCFHMGHQNSSNYISPYSVVLVK